MSDSGERGGQLGLLRPGNNTVPVRASGHSSVCVRGCVHAYVYGGDGHSQGP